jgi:hypothetical protein
VGLLVEVRSVPGKLRRCQLSCGIERPLPVS